MKTLMTKVRLRSAIGALLLGLGLMLGLFTLVHAVTFNPEKSVTLTATPSAGSTYIRTDAGVLTMLGTSPSITLTAEKGEIQWGIGRTEDTEAYLGESAGSTVTGFATASVASISARTASEQAAAADKKAVDDGAVHLDTSDLWFESGKGKGTVTFTPTLSEGFDRALIATTSTGEAPRMSIQWTTIRSTISPVPFILTGMIIALIGLVLLLTEWFHLRRLRTGQAQRLQAAQEQSAAANAQTSVIPAVKDAEADSQASASAEDHSAAQAGDGSEALHGTDLLSERSEESQATGGAFGAAVLPDTEEGRALRQRELSEDDRLLISEEDTEGTDAQEQADPEESEEAAAEGASDPHEDSAQSGETTQAPAEEAAEEAAEAFTQETAEEPASAESTQPDPDEQTGENEAKPIWDYTRPYEDTTEDEADQHADKYWGKGGARA